ncbi:SDR family oxidoreductase [uncultured Erythrobacter sp.]|uniref:SDR family oxidoreductase n=1 Tax=uncultured Erythrobacter sp. TaxID=263913 RepID=UPI0026382FBD|nr:SDR family oxidoreductase [uncultured Erythrobacter sp.]
MKTVLVTGACGIVGAVVWETLVRKGYHVIGVDLADSLPFENTSVDFRGGLDLTSEEAVQSLADTLKVEGRTLDGLVNIAGGFVWEEMLSGSAGTWHRMFEMNVMTTLNSCRAFAPLLNNPSSVINIGAAAADKAGLGMGAYAASKSAVIKLSEALNEELRGRGARVNVISPTIVDTPTNRAEMSDSDFSDWVSPSQIAELAAYLLSTDSSAINGENVRIRGGV